MAVVLTLLMMAVPAGLYAWLEGATRAFLMACNVFLAGLLAFNFWEPMADALEPSLAGSAFAGFEDAFCLMAVFCGALTLLRLGVNRLVPREPEQLPAVRRAGAALFGLAAGYLAAGFLVCVLQTLPWQRDFLSFNPRIEPAGTATFRRYVPPDRVWLALMHRAGDWPLARGRTFDDAGDFEDRYARHRRYGD